MKTKHVIVISVLFLASFGTQLKANNALNWIFDEGSRVVATPALQNDTLFIGGINGNFFALDAHTGAELWRFETGNEIRTTALLYNDKVVFESGNVLYALNTKGNLIWTDTLYVGGITNEHDIWDCFRSFPKLHEGIVYIGSEEGRVIGVDATTGNRVFEAQTSQANASIETPPVFYNGKVIVGDWLGVLTAFDLSSGNEVWHYDTKDDNSYSGWVNAIMSEPIIHKDTLYFGGRHCNLYALNPETGEKYWLYHSPTDQWLFGGPIVHNDTLYTGSSYQASLFAFSPDEPIMLWSTEVYGLNYGNPVIVGDYVIVGTGGEANSATGSLTLINRKSHELAERYNVGGWVETPLVNDGTIYFGSGDGKVYSIDMQTLLNTQRPNTIINQSDIDLGIQPASGKVDTTFYIYNIGAGPDSLSLKTSTEILTVEPTNFKLSANDSILIRLEIDLAGMSAGTKTSTVSFASHWSMFNTDINKRIRYEIEENLSIGSLNADREYFKFQLLPNPASEIISVEFTLKTSMMVGIRIVNTEGRLVKQLPAIPMPAGAQRVELDLSDLKTGNYYCGLSLNGTISYNTLCLKNE